MAVRILRILGWALVAASVVVVVGTVLLESVAGPEGGQVVWPTPRLWRCYLTTLGMATGATILALALGLPAAFALVQARRPWQRSVLYSLTIIPLVTMPSIFAYAWMLLATRPGGAVGGLMDALGWNTRGAEPFQAAWVLATWLWPVPALILAAAFRTVGARAYRLACVDASPMTAFFRGALPVMRAPLIAAAVGVFVLAALDSTIPPLMGATQVWSVEMLAHASIASRFERPAAYLVWQAWPMLATIALVAAAAVPGIRQMTGWADDPDTGDTGTRLPAAAWFWPVACGAAAAITVFPILVFATELAAGRTTAGQALATAYRTWSTDGLASVLVAVSVGAASVAIAVAVLDEPHGPRLRRSAATVIVAGVVAVAVLPPELSATALVGFFSRISPPGTWNVYDNTPWVWIAAMIARFGFLPVCLLRLLNRRVPEDIVSQARTDGAGLMERIAHTRLPILWRPLLGTGLMVACLTLSEAASSVLVQPPQFFGGSLAVRVDSQMHYGRQNETIASSLVLMVPAIILAGVLPWIAASPPRRLARFGRSARRRAGVILLLAATVAAGGCRRGIFDNADVERVFGGPGLGFGEFSYPRGLAVSPVDGCVFVVDKSPTARIQRFSADGQYEHGWSMPEAATGKPTGITVDRHGRVWVPDTHYHRVVVFNRDGNELFRFGEQGIRPGQFIFPTAVALDDDGFIYVAEYGGNDRISKFSPDRQYLFSFADKASGPGWVERPNDIAFDAGGVLWVVDACHHRICRYGRDGRFLSAFGSPGTTEACLNYPYGLAVEKGGTILVADRGNNRIVRFDRDGRFLGTWGTPGRGPGQISQPWDVAVDSRGRIFCLDSWNNRVQVIKW